MEFRKMVTITLQDTAKETQMYRTVFWTLWEREGGMIWENGIETCIISYVKRIAVQAQCMIQDARGWCTGMTQRDGMGREVGAGNMCSGWGTCVHPWQIHVDIWQNQYNIIK